MRPYVHPYSGYPLITLNTHLLLLPSGSTTCIAFHSTNISSHVSLLPTSHVIMNLLQLTLCSPMRLHEGVILSTLMYMELLLIMISPID